MIPPSLIHQRAESRCSTKVQISVVASGFQIIGLSKPRRRSPTVGHRPSAQPISVDSDANMHVGQLDSQGPLDPTGIHGQESYMDTFLVLQ